MIRYWLEISGDWEWSWSKVSTSCCPMEGAHMSAHQLENVGCAGKRGLGHKVEANTKMESELFIDLSSILNVNIEVV